MAHSETKNIDNKFWIATSYQIKYNLRIEKPVYPRFDILMIKTPPTFNKKYIYNNHPFSIQPLIEGNFEKKEYINLKHLESWIRFNLNRISGLYSLFLQWTDYSKKYLFNCL